MELKKIDRTSRDFAPGQRGDYVIVMLNDSGPIIITGYVIRAKEGFLGLAVHETNAGAAPPIDGCLGWEASVPLSSVALIGSMVERPTGCRCHGISRSRS